MRVTGATKEQLKMKREHAVILTDREDLAKAYMVAFPQRVFPENRNKLIF